MYFSLSPSLTHVDRSSSNKDKAVNIIRSNRKAAKVSTWRDRTRRRGEPFLITFSHRERSPFVCRQQHNALHTCTWNCRSSLLLSAIIKTLLRPLKAPNDEGVSAVASDRRSIQLANKTISLSVIYDAILLRRSQNYALG